MNNFREARTSDIPDILTIIKQSKAYFKSIGLDQWQRGYPNQSDVENDILNKTGYLIDNSTSILSYISASFVPEEHYKKITGQWLSNNDIFCTLHRVAVDNSEKGNGIATIMLQNIEKLCTEKNVKNIRVDTHENNKSMRRFLEKNKFVYCGTMIIPAGDIRLAYEKVL